MDVEPQIRSAKYAADLLTSDLELLTFPLCHLRPSLALGPTFIRTVLSPVFHAPQKQEPPHPTTSPGNENPGSGQVYPLSCPGKEGRDKNRGNK